MERPKPLKVLEIEAGKDVWLHFKTPGRPRGTFRVVLELRDGTGDALPELRPLVHYWNKSSHGPQHWTRMLKAPEPKGNTGSYRLALTFEKLVEPVNDEWRAVKLTVATAGERSDGSCEFTAAHLVGSIRWPVPPNVSLAGRQASPGTLVQIAPPA